MGGKQGKWLQPQGETATSKSKVAHRNPEEFYRASAISENVKS